MIRFIHPCGMMQLRSWCRISHGRWRIYRHQAYYTKSICLFLVLDHQIIIRNRDQLFSFDAMKHTFGSYLGYTIRMLHDARRELSMSNRPCWHHCLTVMFSMFYRLQRCLTLFDGCGVWRHSSKRIITARFRFYCSPADLQSEHGIRLSTDKNCILTIENDIHILISQVSFWIMWCISS